MRDAGVPFYRPVLHGSPLVAASRAELLAIAEQVRALARRVDALESPASPAPARNVPGYGECVCGHREALAILPEDSRWPYRCPECGHEGYGWQWAVRGCRHSKPGGPADGRPKNL